MGCAEGLGNVGRQDPLAGRISETNRDRTSSFAAARRRCSVSPFHLSLAAPSGWARPGLLPKPALHWSGTTCLSTNWRIRLDMSRIMSSLMPSCRPCRWSWVLRLRDLPPAASIRDFISLNGRARRSGPKLVDDFHLFCELRPSSDPSTGIWGGEGSIGRSASNYDDLPSCRSQL